MVIFKLYWILWLAAMNLFSNAVTGLPTSSSLFQYESAHSDAGKRGATQLFSRLTYNLLLASFPYQCPCSSSLF